MRQGSAGASRAVRTFGRFRHQDAVAHRDGAALPHQQSLSIHENPRKSAAKKNAYSKPIYPLLLVTLLLFQTACNQQPTESIIAEVGPHTISLKDFQTADKRHRHPPPDALLNKLIDEKALYNQALEQNLDQDPELQRNWQQLLIAKLREQQLEPQLASTQPTDEAIEAHYQSNQPAYTEPAQRHIALIYFECPPALRPEKRKELHERAKAVHKQALTQSPETDQKDFGPLAAEHSHHRSSRYKGGDIGWLQADNTRWEPEIIETAFTLKTKGQMSELIETEHGLFILKLLETKDAYIKPLAEVRPMIQHKLLVEKQNTLETHFIQQARDAVTIKIYPKILDTYEPSK